MSEEIRILCKNFRELPSTKRIRMLVSTDQDLTIEFPNPDHDQRLIDLHRQTLQNLRQTLPGYTVNENCSAQAGPLSLTIQLIDVGRELLDQADLIMTALHRYRKQARQLMSVLARQLQVQPQELNDGNFLMRFRRMEEMEGQLSLINKSSKPRTGLRLPFLNLKRSKKRTGPIWDYHLLADRCRFIQQPSGQIVELCLGYADDFGVFDQASLTKYLRTTPGMETVALLMSDSSMGFPAVLDMLVEHHYLTPVHTSTGDRHYFQIRDTSGRQ